jgi:hypothetical protein
LDIGKDVEFLDRGNVFAGGVRWEARAVVWRNDDREVEVVVFNDTASSATFVFNAVFDGLGVQRTQSISNPMRLELEMCIMVRGR